MPSFREWLRADESRVKNRRPDSRVDDFLDQIVGLAGDMDKASKSKPMPEKPTLKSAPGEEELLRLAKIALSNLSKSPDYYKTRQADLKVGGEQPNNGKVTRDNALRSAKELGINFGDVEFDQEAFRRGIEAEFNRRTAFSREYSPEKSAL